MNLGQGDGSIVYRPLFAILQELHQSYQKQLLQSLKEILDRKIKTQIKIQIIQTFKAYLEQQCRLKAQKYKQILKYQQKEDNSKPEQQSTKIQNFLGISEINSFSSTQHFQHLNSFTEMSQDFGQTEFIVPIFGQAELLIIQQQKKKIETFQEIQYLQDDLYQLERVVFSKNAYNENLRIKIQSIKNSIYQNERKNSLKTSTSNDKGNKLKRSLSTRFLNIFK